MLKNSNIRTTGAALLAMAVIFSPLALAAQDSAPFLGDWKGVINAPGMDIEIILHFKLDANKNISGTIDVTTQNAFGLALDKIKVEKKEISFGIIGAPGDPLMKGTLDDTGKKISGNLSQSGLDMSFSVTKN